MAQLIELPHVGESVVEGTIGKWLKQPGDRVERYDPLVEVVTDKVTMEVPSPVAGELLRIIAQEGETVPMGAPIAEVDDGSGPASQSPSASGRSEQPHRPDSRSPPLRPHPQPRHPISSPTPGRLAPPADRRWKPRARKTSSLCPNPRQSQRRRPP